MLSAFLNAPKGSISSLLPGKTTIPHSEATITVHRVMMRRTQVICLVMLIVLAAVAGCIDHWIPRLCSIICGIIAVCALFFPETHIDVQRGQVTEVARFLGVVPVWRRQRAMSDFIAIRCYCHGDSESTATWLVALQPHTGWPVDVRQFSAPSGQDCAEAKEFALAISSSTGLKLE